MNGALAPIRVVVILTLIVVGLLFVLGILNWNKDRYSCLDGPHFYGDWVVTAAIGKLEFRQKAWGCEKYQRYGRDFKPGVKLKDYPPINP